MKLTKTWITTAMILSLCGSPHLHGQDTAATSDSESATKEEAEIQEKEKEKSSLIPGTPQRNKKRRSTTKVESPEPTSTPESTATAIPAAPSPQPQIPEPTKPIPTPTPSVTEQSSREPMRHPSDMMPDPSTMFPIVPTKRAPYAASVINEEFIKGMKPGDEEELKAMVIIASRVQRLNQETADWEKNEPKDEEMGNFERIRSRAERFSVERKTRKRLESEVEALLHLVRIMSNKRKEAAARIKERRDVARMIDEEQSRRMSSMQKRQTIITIEAPEDEDEPRAQKPENYELYELKEAATFQEVSTRPDIYNDRNKWHILYTANNHNFPRWQEKIPRGSVLIVPRVRASKDIDF